MRHPPHFFISRYAANKEHAGYVYRAVQSIRRIYPEALVTVVDDSSHPDFRYMPDCPLTDVVTNPYPRSGEMGTMRVAWSTLRSPDAVAVTMHDGMVLTAPVPEDCLEQYDIRFLWHFDRYFAMHLPDTLRLLSHLSLPTSNLLYLTHGFTSGFNRSWRGCFGMAIVARKKGLDRIHKACQIFGHKFMSAVNTRDARQAAERIVGLVVHAFISKDPADGSGLIPSLCGCIFDHPEPWSMRSASHSLDAILNNSYPGPFFKTWSGR